MNIREAILKAADHIEKNPHLYNFIERNTPECGTPGCMLGRISFFLGHSPGMRIWLDGAKKVVGVDSDTFTYRLMAMRDTGEVPAGAPVFTGADGAPTFLRAYADKYHPESKSLPQSRALVVYKDGADIVRDWFKAVA